MNWIDDFNSFFELKSYWVALKSIWDTKKEPTRAPDMSVERMKGVEPSCPAWEAGVLPMNYTRILICIDDTTLFPNFPVFLITSSKETVSHDLPSFHVIFWKQGVIRCENVSTPYLIVGHLSAFTENRHGKIFLERFLTKIEQKKNVITDLDIVSKLVMTFF